MNYLTWISNLGVVPLFLLAAFLFAPEAFFLFLRRVSVIAVLEAINISQWITNYFLNLKLLNLTRSLLFVKALLLLPCASNAQISQFDLILAKGEQKELLFSQLNKLSVGNSEVITHKLIKNKLLIKGKKIGFSDLIVWSPKPVKYNIYVLSKQKYLKTIQLADALGNLGLVIDIKGPMITAKGEVLDLADYLYLHKIKKQFQEQVFFKIKLSSQLRNLIISKVYQELYSRGFSKVSCTNQWLDVNCRYEGSHQKSVIDELKKNYSVNFSEEESISLQKNYRLKMKIVQLEGLDGQELKFGLDKLSASVGDLFEFGLRKLIDENVVLLSQSHMELSTLAEPELIVNLTQPQLVEIGSQIPFQNVTGQRGAIIAPIDWKFAGLRITTNITPQYGKFLIKYGTEFSRPMDQGISGSKEESTVFLRPGESIKIFQIGYKTSSLEKNQIPYLSEIPILKELFTSRSKGASYKQIYGYISIDEVE
jgi:hypothetical protein